MAKSIFLSYKLPCEDLSSAGEASSGMKNTLKKLGVNPVDIKRAAISMYEAEINAVIHGKGGQAEVEITLDKVRIVISDQGPGIPDIEQAMQEGYSTAPAEVRSMGFGAGMGLPNIAKHADVLQIESSVGIGTSLIMEVKFN
ncbi:MAG: ATP-binding protein [Clostridia bacterium]